MVVFFPHAHLLVIALTTSMTMYSVVNASGNQFRLFKNGNAIIGGLVVLHEESDTNTGCGKFLPAGLGQIEAIIYSINKINRDTTILPNFTLGYDLRDVCYNTVIASKHAFQFSMANTMNCMAFECITDSQCLCSGNNSSGKLEKSDQNYSTIHPVVAVVGESTSRVAIPVANLFQAVQIPHVDWRATSEELSSSTYKTFFRTIPSDTNQAKAFADIIDHFGWRYVAAIAVDDSYGRQGMRELERLSDKCKSFCVELFSYIPLPNYKHKLKSIVSSLKLRETVRVIVVWSHFSQGRDLLWEASKQRLENRIWIFSEAFAMTKPEVLSPIPNLSSTGIHFGVQMPSFRHEDFLDHFKNRIIMITQNSSRDEHRGWKTFLESKDFDHNCSIGKSIKEGCDIEESAMRFILNDFVPFGIDTIYTIAHAMDRMIRCLHPNGSKIVDKGSCPSSNNKIKARDVIQYLKTVEFEGLTGRVRFDSRGDPVEAIYDIVYFNISKKNGSQIITKNVIGRWDKKSRDALSINEASLPWKKDNKRERTIPSSSCTDECKPGQWKARISDCCWKCISCTDGSISETHGALNCTKCINTQMSNYERTQCQPLPMTNIKWSDLLAIILTIASILGVAFGICAFIILFHFRDTPIVKALNKICTFGLLLGIALCFIMTLLYIAKPSSGLCSFLKPSRYVVYTLCCSALFLKTMQLVHAFNITGYKGWIKAFIFSTKRQVVVLSLIISMEVLLGAGWILIDPPYARLTIFPKSHVFITCVHYRGTAGKVFDNLMLVYLLLMAACCIYYAYRARNLPANFNEAKYISFSLYIFLLSWITYYPIEYAVEGWYVAVLSGATLLLSSYGLLGCMFGPKLYIIICHPEKNTTEFVRAEMRQNNVSQSVNNSGSVRPISDKET